MENVDEVDYEDNPCQRQEHFCTCRANYPGNKGKHSDRCKTHYHAYDSIHYFSYTVKDVQSRFALLSNERDGYTDK